MLPLVILATALALGGCGRGRGGVQEEAGGYLAPPMATAARASANGVTLSGQAPALAQVRLASPAGQAVSDVADRSGRWEVSLPAGPARLFGLSMTVDGRRTQAQGYVLVGPNGQAAMLRSGAGALRLDLGEPGIGAVDFDGLGGAVVSGRAPPDSLLALRLDGRHAADGRADAEGRFSIGLPDLALGQRRIEIAGDGFADAVQFEATRPEPLAAGPWRSQLSPAGLRIDWLTPGGGVQSTLIPG